MKKIFILIVVVIALGVLGWWLPKSEISPAEEFNLSGQAKVVEDETDLWQLYTDDLAGFSLKYPYDVSLDSQNNSSNLILTIESTKIDDLDYPGFNKADVLQDIQLLAAGKFTENSGVYGGLSLSKKIIDPGQLNGEERLVLSRFEVCDVTFERQILFYHNDYRVVITLEESNKSNITDNSPQYFQVDEENCGDAIIWDFTKQNQFYEDLVAGEGSFIAQEWFDTFDEIIATIEI